MSETNIIDKPLMSTVQWIFVCIAIAGATKTVDVVLYKIDRTELRQGYIENLHEKDMEILLHKLKAKGGRDDTNFNALWTEFNKLKENHNEK